MSKKLPFAHFKTLKQFSMKDLWLRLRRAPPYFNHFNSHVEKLNYHIIDPQCTGQVSRKNYHLSFKKQEKDKIIAQGKQEPDSIRKITSKTYQSHTNSPHKQLWGQLSFSTSDLVLLYMAYRSLLYPEHNGVDLQDTKSKNMQQQANST